MIKKSRLLALALLFSACASGGAQRTQEEQLAMQMGTPTQLPDTAWGTHVLIVGPGPRNTLWVGTYGRGIFVWHPDSSKWERIVSSNDSTSISWNFVNSFNFPADSSIWYGTVGNGWGRSTDRGKTWKNWQLSQLGPEWQYVVPDGIQSRGDTVYIATADGLRITTNGGNTYRCIQATSSIAGGSTRTPQPCAETLKTMPAEYLLSISLGGRGDIWVGHLGGAAVSNDGGRSWKTAAGIPNTRIRSIWAGDTSGVVWAADEKTVYQRVHRDSAFKKVDIHALGWPNGLPGTIRAVYPSTTSFWPVIVTSFGLAMPDFNGSYRLLYLPAGEQYRPAADIWDMTWYGVPLWPISGSGRGLNLILAGDQLPGVVGADAPMAAPARDPIYSFFERPIHDGEGNPYIDQTYRYGSTMGGNFQQHQGVEFNNPAGVPVHPIGAGVVVYSGPAEAGANTIAIRHDAKAGDKTLYSVYYHNSSLNVKVGDRVTTNDVIAHVGNTGRATNDHMHLEVHVAPSTADSSAIVNPNERFPAYTTNPQLWIRPVAGTGIVAGRVRDAQGKPVPGARIYGLVVPNPEETPYSFAETYREHAHSTPGYDEDFAVGDVPAGTYLVGVEIAGTKVWRTVRVEAGRVTIVEFSPATQ